MLRATLAVPAAALWLMLTTAPSCSGPAGADPAYVEEIERYRADRLERLRAPDGWLTLVGLFWLDPGESTFGSAASNEIVLPANSAPPVAGRFMYDGSSVRLVVEPGVDLTVAGEAVDEVSFDSPPGESPPVVTLGRLQILVIERGGKHAVRVRDLDHPARTRFPGLEYYPIDAEYRVRARLRRFESPRQIEVATVVGTPQSFLVPGKLEFELDRVSHTLEPLISDPSDTELFVIFKDDTSGRETYGAGRYLYATLDGEEAVLDFNRAYNPPCAFTAFATCPLAPPQNRLETPVRAGEKHDGH